MFNTHVCLEKNDVRKGFLDYLNKYIETTTPHSSTDSIYNLEHKPLRLHSNIQFTSQYFHNYFTNVMIIQ